jgi:hypothetical protein
MNSARAFFSRARASALVLASSCLFTTFAHAQVPPSPFQLTVIPILGKFAGTHAPQELLVRVESKVGTPVAAELSLGRDAQTFATASLVLAPHEATVTRLLANAQYGEEVSLRDAKGTVLKSEALSFVSSGGEHMLFHASADSRLLNIHEWSHAKRGGGANIVVGGAQADRISGDLILPEYAISYSGVALVLIGSDQLARLQEREAAALNEFVVSGGTLAVTIQRPEDVRGERLIHMTGGVLVPDPKGFANALKQPVLASPGSGKTISAPADEGGDGDDGESGAPNSAPLAANSANQGVRPTEGLGYLGGALKPSGFGSEAAYGLGRIVILPYDPGAGTNADSVFVVGRLIDLLDESATRKATGFPPLSGAGSLDVEEIRRALDPNENFRLALGVSTVVLMLYGILFFPLLFGWAAKRGKLFAPLKWTPIASLGTFSLIVVIGLLSRGLRGSAEHLAFHDLGAGAQSAHRVTYRGLFSSGSKELLVKALQPGASIALLEDYSAFNATSSAHYRMQRDGLELEGIRAKPWSTVVIREDSVVQDLGSVSIQETDTGVLRVANHSRSDLTDVFVRSPSSGDLRYFEKLVQGETVDVGSGRLCSTTRTLSRFELSALESCLSNEAQVRLKRSWGVWENHYPFEFWPTHTPVLIATMKPESSLIFDTQYRLKHQARFLRVVGYGGTL